jgi:hypothetical protein
VLVAEYKDEAFSAYRRDRGPGLVDATQHAEDLAVQYGVAELWAQHSDRIARGDGKAAQHTVEVALWALKHDIRVRTLQDPDTFRDLLYAVVTGQRNNEDSRRKGAATQGGMRRAAERGEFIGHLPDGYLLHTWLDERKALRKRMVLDPERRALIELIFRLALRGRNCGQIAASVNNAGWQTKMIQKHHPPRPFELGRIYEILKNPRYAALSVRCGEVLARGHWPAYISERQHERILRQLAHPNPAKSRRQRESYLLARVGHCGHCGHPFHVMTGERRPDGEFSRRYVCSSHSKHRGRLQCTARPIDAHTAEAIVIASIGTLLIGTPGQTSPEQSPPLVEDAESARRRLREGVLLEDEQQVQQAIESLFARMQPQAALIRDAAISQRQARELADADRLRAWIEAEDGGRSEQTRVQSKALNQLLRGWFAQIAIKVESRTITIAARRHDGAGAAGPASEVIVDRADWTRFAMKQRRQMVRYGSWDDAEIIGALRAWADEHGRSPTPSEWVASGANHPVGATLRAHLGDWNGALARAGLEPPAPYINRKPWDELDTIQALRVWSETHGRPPWSMEWDHAQPEHPCSNTVRERFGSWQSALAAAGLEVPPRRARAQRRWSRQEIVAALADWSKANGRAPRWTEWKQAGPGYPCSGTVRNRFGSWGQALAEASLLTSDAARRS